MSSSKRLSILNQLEYDELYALPQFRKEDRPEFFSLNDAELSYLNRLSKSNSKAYFLLQLGYFRVKRRFFDVNLSKPHHDLRYVQRNFLNNAVIEKWIPSRNSKAQYRNKILEFTGFHAIDEKSRRALKKFAKESVRRNLKPRAILSEILDYLRERKFETPEYSFLSDLIGATIEAEQQRLGRIVRKHTDANTKKIFSHFLGENNDEDTFLAVRCEAKNLRFKEIGNELLRYEKLGKVHSFAKKCIAEFEISTQNIKYLASLAAHYKLPSLRSLPRDFSSVILCCYVYFRFQRSTDTLIDAFQIYISRLKKNAIEFAKKELYKQRQNMTVDTEKVAKILDLYLDESIPDKESFVDVKNMAFKILTREEIEHFSNYLKKDFVSVDSMKWDFYADKHLSFKKNLRPILRALVFYSNKKNDHLIRAIGEFQDILARGRALKLSSKVNKNFIPNRLKSHVVDGVVIHPRKYEFMLYTQVSRRLDAKDLFVQNSTKHLSFAEDLISDNQWQKRDDYLQNSPFTLLSKNPVDLLNDLEQQLEEKIATVNDNIKNGRNTGIVIKTSSGKSSKSSWVLPYKKRNFEDNNSVFDLLQPANICDVISYVHQETGFLDSFEHIQPRFAKSRFSLKSLSACLIAAGSNLGLQKIAEIADININSLATTYRNYFHVDYIRSGSRQVINAAAGLAAYKHFDVRSPGSIHAAADGQKFGVRRQNQKARHSPKYFHKGTGVVAYSLLANHFPINALTIGAHDHESHYLFDLVFNNWTDIDPDIVSTDMHGVNHLNFALLHMFGRQFAPRYTSLQRQFADLRGFKDLDSYDQMLVNPQKKVDRQLIISEWENILRILLSLALKQTSQSIIVSKLSSHKFSDKTKRALWELDGILKSMYMLNYLDNEHLRQDVCRAENRIESYHQLKRAIANIAGGKFRGSSENEIDIWSECARLLTNCIIYYNTDILSRILKKSGHSPEMIDAINRISPVAWQHINFLGKYVFRDEKFQFDVERLLADIDIQKFSEAA